MFHTKSNYAVTPRSISGLMEDIFNNGWGRTMSDDSLHTFSVPVNIKEDDKGYELQVIAPGLNKEDFKLNLEKNVLHISFEQKDDKTEKTEKWLRNEYHFRSFKRSFTLNEKIDANGISAKYTDGILNISLPKKETAEPTKQEITIA